jgi:hypothetical protein
MQNQTLRDYKQQYTSEEGYNAATSSWRDMQNNTHILILLASQSCSQVIDLACLRLVLHDEICSIQILSSYSSYKWTQEKDTERVETYPLKNPSSCRRRRKQKEAQAWKKSCSMLSVSLFFLMMPGGSGLPSPDTVGRKEYVTRIILVAVLEGWATQSPISQEFF